MFWLILTSPCQILINWLKWKKWGHRGSKPRKLRTTPASEIRLIPCILYLSKTYYGQYFENMGAQIGEKNRNFFRVTKMSDFHFTHLFYDRLKFRPTFIQTNFAKMTVFLLKHSHSNSLHHEKHYRKAKTSVFRRLSFIIELNLKTFVPYETKH